MKKMAVADVIFDEEENDEGRMQDCVYVECRESGDRVGPIWGDSDASVKRALATLTEECSCGASFHGSDE